ncbi:flagellar hook-length control protein FliK [Alcanivorax balearicus MACL04]|uniref:Flagellar hook-length control protein FliK n=1 Tax=Alloalcanivorax balearicus MACL04 TaxID=1177182 RepID=A0ABT2R3F1_9GAMM|nr:flagellar hook-length control protein FliK [Alloalcanivorax balearicus]MCU5784242.1 flagellar hook-length control protein FliK [Alloalcanivorax balearicus MACL04]
MDIQSLLTLPGSGLKPATNAAPAEGADFATALRLLSQNAALPAQAGIRTNAPTATALAPLTDDAFSQALRAPLLGEAKGQQKGLPEHAADSDAGDKPEAVTALLAPVVQTAIPAAPAGNNAQSGAESREARMPAVATSPSPVTAESQVIKPENQGPAPSLPQTVAATESADLPRPAVAPSGAEPPILNTPGTERSHSATAPAPASPVTSSAAISTTVGQPGWGQELGLQLAQWQQRGEHRVELHLHPAELGPLSVSLKVDDQGAQAQFFSAHGQVRQALEQALPQLREALAQQGINLGEASVSDQQPGQQQPSHFVQPESGAPSNVMLADAEDLEPVASPARTVSVSQGVDLYA